MNPEEKRGLIESACRALHDELGLDGNLKVEWVEEPTLFGRTKKQLAELDIGADDLELAYSWMDAYAESGQSPLDRDRIIVGHKAAADRILAAICAPARHERPTPVTAENPSHFENKGWPGRPPWPASWGRTASRLFGRKIAPR